MTIRLQNLALLAATVFVFAANYPSPKEDIQRPWEVWAIRSVLDKKPRMLTLALDKECYAAYDLVKGKLYKVWKGGITLEGAAYTNKKDIQPGSWGTAYMCDSLPASPWHVSIRGNDEPARVLYKGYAFKNQQIYLHFALVLSSKDTVLVTERPEFVRNTAGKPGLERMITTSKVPEGVAVSLQTFEGIRALPSNKTTYLATYFDPLPEQFPPPPTPKAVHPGRALMDKSDCFVCHKVDENEVGPAFQRVAQRYPNNKKSVDLLVNKIREGGTGVWGTGVMNSHALLTEPELTAMVSYIFTLKPKEIVVQKPVGQPKKEQVVQRINSPGFGAPLEKVHPSYDLQTLHTKNFKPRVGALAFKPDGRLLVTTWDEVGGVYLLDNVTTGDTNKITVKRIASGLAEPLGIEVVNGEIYVLQKHELTKLIDTDGDEIIDEYRVVCNSWGVTADFHEFAFGLVYKEGYFYVTLSMAMRLKPDEKQLPDRGRTIKIAPNGSFESVNYGLRTPNGIGLGVDNELFVTDNQGQWLPGNKFIHVKKGEFNGMAWGWLSDEPAPRMVPPAIWLPEDEIGNSPSEPVLIKEGPYKGQMLHGDVTHGGIQRDFLEKINGEYQGAVFRFSQGFEAGVNRLRWGPDGALYVGEVGMAGGGWSWKDRVQGLQKIKYNGKSTFEMLAVRAKPQGFEIEFTEPLKEGQKLRPADILIHQWWYLPTKNYGGPKMDLTAMNVEKLSISEDRTRVFLEIPNLKKEHVVYFRLPDTLKSHGGQSLWSSEAWYTLNNIPN
ncbi:c-type cytochrome [Runella sp. CRIBMP]|uniref:c-type cytochrome n=1 Tax=Runella sp. CRIBMP TaxID=2683261 RepID=UPI001412DC9D|nr:c-type cytochrome [Runella sp. CRIBMP]NBB18430.1 c-type cytochrome [Runella sp. CRIBMP]